MRSFSILLAPTFLMVPTSIYGADLLVGSPDAIRRYDGITGGFVRAVVPGTAIPTPTSFTFGLDGLLYVTSQTSGTVSRVDVNTGVVVDTFVSKANNGGLGSPAAMSFGPDGNLYIEDFTGASVRRYNGQTGAYMGVFTSGYGLVAPIGMTFGPDGNLYVADEISIVKFNGSTGAFINVFVAARSDGLSVPPCGPAGAIQFGPDGNLYSAVPYCSIVARYNGTTGAFIDFFVPSQTAGLKTPNGIVFGPDGNLYVADGGTPVGIGGQLGQVLKFDGKTGAPLGAFVPSGSGGLVNAEGVIFLPPPKTCGPANFNFAPKHGGNSGTITFSIEGCSLSQGSTVKLTGVGSDIVGSPLTISNGGLLATLTFNLVGASPGLRNVVVTNPDNTTITLTGSFMVDQGGGADIHVSVLGRPVMRAAQTQAYFVDVINSGNVDGLARIWVSFPSYVQWSSPQLKPASSGQMNGMAYLAFDLPTVTVASGSLVSILLTAPDNPIYAHQKFQVQAWQVSK